MMAFNFDIFFSRLFFFLTQNTDIVHIYIQTDQIT